MREISKSIPDGSHLLFRFDPQECQRDGRIGIREESKEKEGNFCEARRIGNNSGDDKHEDQSFGKPPDIRNWFPSYESEYPVLDAADCLKESVIKESVCEKDGFTTEESKNKREEKAKDLGNCGNNNEVRAGEKLYPKGSIKCKSSFENVCENKPLEPPDIRNWFPSYLYESPVLDENIGFLCDKTECEGDDFANQDNERGRNGSMEIKTKHKKDFTENLEAKAQRVDPILPGGNMKFVQGAGASSMSPSTHGRGNNKENEGKEVQGNGLVTTSKSIITKPNDENSLDRHRQQQILFDCAAEVSNFEHPDVIGVTGKLKCPRKCKPNRGPPMKQLRLERWVHRP
ncbi:unnamed protein product [Dovyalis caffra]|uniref:Uncharacterized protein n=1 Tax=Dovyalis caffra TaxID=77055 RepID=A0AAV1SRR6_9ROSI|nr:unnamed protein product [Dovyalis caffra]